MSVSINVGIEGVEQVKKELDSLGQGIKDMGKSASTTKGLDDISESLKNINSSASFTGMEIAKLSAGVATLTAAAYTVGKTIFGIANTTALAGEAMLKMSQQTGMSVESLSALKYAADLSNTNIMVISSSLGILSRNLTLQQGETNQSAKALADLGIYAKDSTGHLKPMDVLLLEISDKFVGIKNESERSAYAMALFGRGGGNLIPLLLEGSAGITKMTEEAKRLGITFTAETAKAADDFTDNLVRLKAHTEALTYSIGNFLIPAFNRLLEAFLTPENLKAQDALRGVEFRVKTLKEAIQRTSEELKNGQGDTATLTGRLKSLESQLQAAEGKFKGLKETAREFVGPIQKVNVTNEEAMKIYAALDIELKAHDSMLKGVGKSYNKNEADAKSIEKALNSLSLLGVAPTDNDFKKLSHQLREFTSQTDASRLATKQLEMDLAAQGTQAVVVLGEFQSLLDTYRVTTVELTTNSTALGGNEEALRKVWAITGVVDDKQKELGQTVVTITSMIQTATEGVAEAIKGIWSDATTTVNDAWHNALDVFVDVMAKMVAQAITKTGTISLAMASATAGITLVVGLLASIFGGGSGGGGTESTVEKSTKAFLKSIRNTLVSFEEELLGTLKHLTNIAGRTTIDIGSLNNMVSLYGKLSYLAKNTQWWGQHGDFKASIASAKEMATQWNKLTGEARSWGEFWGSADFQGLVNQMTDMIFDHLSNIKEALVEEYNIRKRVASDTIALYQKQQDFLKGMGSTIIDVKRSLFTDTELFSAQTKDIDTLKASLAGLTGEKKLTVVEDLKSAYLAAWGNAQKLFAGDTASLLKWQEFTVRGLEELQQSGKSAYDQLIDVNLEILGVQRTSVNIETQMLNYTKNLSSVVEQTLLLLEQIGLGGVSSITPEIIGKLSGYLKSVGFAKGGFINKPTYAMMGEAGQELVLPLSKPGRTAQLLNQAGLAGGNGGGVVVQNVFHGPVVWDEISANQYAKKQTKLIQAELRRYV